MLWRLLRVAEAALNYEGRRGFLGRGHPLLIGAATLIVWIGLMLYPPPLLLSPFGVALLFHLLSERGRAIGAAKAGLYASLFIGGVSAVLSPYRPLSTDWLTFLLTVLARGYGISSTALLVVSELGPVGAQAVSSRVHPFIHDTVLLFYRTAPLAVEDLLLSYGAQKLIGKGVKDVLVAATFTGVRRAELLHVSLYTRGARRGRRSALPLGWSPWIGWVVLGLSAASLLLPLLS
ncbi:MAG: hypothetical protein F7C35_01780 [Desulfurococcales archaeon]|nr:hypothetical protein [Desulfurococcales archaeon]